MRYLYIFGLTVLFLTSCDKEKDIEFNSSIINAIILTPKDQASFNYLMVDVSMYRSLSVPRDYALSDLRNEKDCYFHIKKVIGNVTGHTGPAYYILLHDKPHIYIRTVFSGADNAYYLRSTAFQEGTLSILDRPFAIDDDPSYMYIIHRMGKDSETGMDMIAIESVSQRGLYVDNRGLAVQGMALVALSSSDKPENAYRWLVGKP